MLDQVVVVPAWHEGEVAIQRHAGVADLMAPMARRAIRDHLPEQHRAFFSRLPFIVAGTVDPSGLAWATLLVGQPGFVRSPSPTTLQVEAVSDRSDPAQDGLKDRDAIGLLGIELHTRRRNRLNGIIQRTSGDRFDVAVAESYGNCPQYIRLRDFSFARDPALPFDGTVEALTQFDAAARRMITTADTFFLASYVDRTDGRRQVDVSHKAGRPGFVDVDAQGVITVPDFAGNLYFNTLGNIFINPRCALLFVSFESGDVLQISGDGYVDLDSPQIASFQGAERLLRVTPRRIVRRAGALALRWSPRVDGMSPNVQQTGTWAEAATRTRWPHDDDAIARR